MSYLVTNDENEKKHIILKALKALPLLKREALFILTRLLKDISDNQDVNLMGSQNLAVVFAPNLLRPRQEDPKTIITDARATFDVVDQLINNHEHFKENIERGLDSNDAVEKSMARFSKIRTKSILMINDFAKEMNMDEKMLDVISEKIRAGTIYPQTFTRFKANEKAIRRPVSWTETHPQMQNKAHKWKTLRPRDVNLVLKNVRDDNDKDKETYIAEGDSDHHEGEQDWSVFQKNFLQRMYKLTVRPKRARSDNRKASSFDGLDFNFPEDHHDMATELTNIASENTPIDANDEEAEEDTNLTNTEISNILEGLDDLLSNVGKE